MNIKTFDDVLSDDLLELVQIELNLFMYVKHTSTEGADNYFFASDTSNHSTHDFLLKYFNNKYNLDYKNTWLRKLLSTTNRWRLSHRRW